VLSLPVRLQGFQPVAGRNPEIAKHPGLIQETKFSERDVLNVGR
jgi:hypothetical protein